MKNTAPHYLLITEAKTVIGPRENGNAPLARSGQWRFVLEQMGYESRVEVADIEPLVFGERLELLVVVRGLESLEQPSRVTLLTASRYVGRGIRNGIAQWRENNWRWERFGGMTTIKNADLWQRVDHAMSFHQLECRVWNFAASVQEDSLASATTRERNERLATAVRNEPVNFNPHPVGRTNRLSQRISLREPKGDALDLGHAGHFEPENRHAAVTLVDSNAEPAPMTRTDTAHRRAGIIRPHGDQVATSRRAFAPPAFATDDVVLAGNVPQNQHAEQAFSRQVSAAIASPPPNRRRTDHPPIDAMTRENPPAVLVKPPRVLVKPPRQGRAYGQAIN